MDVRHILVLEDQSWWQRILADAIRNGALPSCAIHDADSYQSAMNLIENHRFDAALLDYGLGENRTGLDVARVLRDRFPALPIYLVSMTPEAVLLPLCEPINVHIIQKGAELADSIVEAVREALTEFDAVVDRRADAPSL